MKFSVLICTYNRHELLGRALDALIVRTEEKPDQVVVVNAGEEQAEWVVKAFMGRHGIEVKVVRAGNKSLAANRNAGLPHCVGDIIAMTDDDAEVFPNWVFNMTKAHQEHPEAGAVGGLVLGSNTESLISKVADVITFPSWPGPRYVRTLPGVNISYKREVVQQVGFQDESLFRGEDVDYNWRVQKLGYKIYFDPSIKVYHYHRPTLQGFLHQHYMYGRAYYLVRSKWQDMYCVYPHRISRFRDLLKAVNFVATVFYQPLLMSLQIPCFSTRLASIPVLFCAGLAWKGGMLMQAFHELRSNVSQ